MTGPTSTRQTVFRILAALLSLGCLAAVVLAVWHSEWQIAAMPLPVLIVLLPYAITGRNLWKKP